MSDSLKLVGLHGVISLHTYMYEELYNGVRVIDVRRAARSKTDPRPPAVTDSETQDDSEFNSSETRVVAGVLIYTSMCVRPTTFC